MPAPFDVETLGNGASLVTIDSHGNLTAAGSVGIGKVLLLAVQSAAPIQIPGELQLYTTDGQTLSMINGQGLASTAAAPAWAAPAVLITPVNVTGTTAKSVLGTGITIPAGALAGGQAYNIRAWGTVTTTADTQTVTLEVDLAGQSVLTWGAQTPNASAPVTGAAWFLEAAIDVLGTSLVSAGGWNGLDFFPSSVNQVAQTILSGGSIARQITLQVTPSDPAVSMTVNGFICTRAA
jgi:hypothetical protein